MTGIQNFPDNVMYEGDNLPFLRGMNSETVDLIATDPPFNKKRNRAGTAGQYEDAWRWADHPTMKGQRPDQWKWQPVNREWLEEIKDDNPALYAVIESTRLAQDDDTAAFLCFLGVRLLEMRRVLKPTGSIYLHCDDSANSYIKSIMDTIFGADNFRSIIVWQRTSAHNDTKQGRKQYGRIHDTILFYTKSDELTWNPGYTDYDPEYIADFYKYVEPETGRRYRLGDLTGPGGEEKGNPRYEVMGVTRYWRYSQERMQELIDEGRIVQTKPGGVPSYKRYLDEMPGVPLQDIWTDIKVLGARSKERTGSPDQKPLALYERIIQVSSNEGDVVLDPFAGCATTPIAAHRLGRRWVGIDRRADGYEHILNRLKQNGIMVDDEHDWQAPLLLDGAVLAQHSTEPPVRTDDGNTAAPGFVLPLQRVKAKWELLNHGQMRDILAEAQASDGQVVCAGCGIVLPLRYMELDHREPRKDGGANTIDNRVLICGPCNRAKRDNFTISGLIRHNQREKNMVSKERADLAASKARDSAERCKAEMA